MKCENCKKTRSCEKPHNICKDFELYGEKPDKPKKSKDLCSGCRNDYYNHHKSGITGKNGCMSYKTARVILKSYPHNINQRPPWCLKYQLSCFARKWH